MLLMRIVAYNISLLWSSCLGVALRIYKHSAPPEGCGQAAPCNQCARSRSHFQSNRLTG